MKREKSIISICEFNNFIADPFEIQIDEATWVQGYLIMDRVNVVELNKILPEGVKVYGIRHNDDDDSIPATIENGNVFVNNYGNFITGEYLDYLFKENHWRGIIDWNYIC